MTPCSIQKHPPRPFLDKTLCEHSGGLVGRASKYALRCNTQLIYWLPLLYGYFPPDFRWSQDGFLLRWSRDVDALAPATGPHSGKFLPCRSRSIGSQDRRSVFSSSYTEENNHDNEFPFEVSHDSIFFKNLNFLFKNLFFHEPLESDARKSPKTIFLFSFFSEDGSRDWEVPANHGNKSKTGFACYRLFTWLKDCIETSNLKQHC